MSNARKGAPVGNRAGKSKARIMVTESNGSVERMVQGAGGIVVSGGGTIAASVEKLAECDGLLITGGGDVNPHLYGHERHGKTQPVSATRDYREVSLLGAARHLGLPVMGICRGMQVIAVEAGGTLYQHVPDRVGHQHHDCSMMPVTTVRGSVVNRALGDHPDMMHLHHQSVRQVPNGFQVTATHVDGTVEAIESTDGRVIAVQFHPESVGWGADASDHTGYRLFDAFVRACDRYARRAKHNGRKLLPHPATFMDQWPVAREQYEHSLTRWSHGGGNTYYNVTGGRTVGTRPTAKSSTRLHVVKSAEESAKTIAELLDDCEVFGEGDPVAFCDKGCYIGFDEWSDYTDHMWYFHQTDVLEGS